jgi:ankyrin repeat protein
MKYPGRLKRTWAVAGLLAMSGLAPAADTPELVAAVKAGNRAAAILLIEAKVDLTAPEPDGTTALHWAARQNDIELAERLLEAGADPNARNRYGVSPLYVAAVNGSAPMLEQLVAAGASANEIGSEGETVLMTVARTGRSDAARVLIDAGAIIDARETWHGQTALMWAAAEGHAGMLHTLINAGADVNALSNLEEWERQRTAEPRDKWLPPGAMSALLFAAREGCTDCVSILASAGADVSQTTPDGISGLVSAVINGHYDTAAALIDHGIDPNLLDYTGRGALYAAADFNTMPSSNRPAPSVIENEHTALDIINMLLERGADPNRQLARGAPYRAKLDRGNDTVLAKGTTPLLRAAKAGDLPALQALIAHGADPLLTTDRGVNALMLAAGVGTQEQDTTGRYKTEAQAIEAIELLLAQGVDIDAGDSRGRTALHGAALQGYNEVVSALVEFGADLKAADNKGFTPLDTALGLAGGWGFAGNVGVVQESTAALIQELLEDVD